MGTRYQKEDHVFAVCAYGESKYLEQCIYSLLSQSLESNIMIFTSTPNEHISDLARKHDLPLVINDEKGSIAADWNFAYENAPGKLVTLAHQDDIYYPDFLKQTLKHISRAKEPMIAFTAYHERHGQKTVTEKEFINLRIKRAMLAPLSLGAIQGGKWIRRRILSFGNPICCPSVTYVKDNLPQRLFAEGLNTNLDWATWEKLSRRDGRFVYIPEALMAHRIYEDSVTGMLIQNGTRSREDLKMLMRFWPGPFAKAINALYSKSQKSRLK